MKEIASLSYVHVIHGVMLNLSAVISFQVACVKNTVIFSTHNLITWWDKLTQDGAEACVSIWVPLAIR